MAKNIFLRNGVRSAKYIYQWGIFEGTKIFLSVSKSGALSSFSIPNIRAEFYLRPGTSDVSVFDHVFVDKEYELGSTVKDPKFIIDAGANIGCTSVYFANKYPNAKIVAVEPEQSNFELLVKNCKPYPNITPIQAAVWKNKAILRIENPNADNWSFRVEETEDEKWTGISIPALTILDLMLLEEHETIDILKIDIESGEKEVFESGYEKWLPKVNVLITELHDRIKPGCSYSFYKAITSYPFNQTIKGWNVIITRQ